MDIKWNKINWDKVDEFFDNLPGNNDELDAFWEHYGYDNWKGLIPDANLPYDDEKVLICFECMTIYRAFLVKDSEDPYFLIANDWESYFPTWWAKLNLPDDRV